MIMDVIPGEEPSSGPNYWNFDPNVLYKFSIDNNRDGRAEDIEFELQFRNEIRGIPAALGLPLSYVGCGPPTPDPTCASTLPPITALDGAGSEGLGLRQRYSLTMIQHHHRTRLANGLIAVPSNVGPRTMPDYDALAAQGVNTLGGGIKVFAGQREDPFYIDLGGVFDTLNLRRFVPGESAAEDADDNTNPFGVDMLSGFNVHSIALEMPASVLTGQTGTSVLGAYASTSRPHVTVHGRRTWWLRPGPAAGQPARQRGDHRNAGQGRVERRRAGGRAAVRGLLPQPQARTGPPGRLRHPRRNDRQDRSARPAAEVPAE